MISTKRTISQLLAILPVVVLIPLGGCQSTSQGDLDRWKFSDMFDLEKGMPWQKDGPKVGIPTRVVVSWTDGVRHTPAKTSERGFGGRLHFYAVGSHTEPIAVDGQLVVYAFDESSRDPTDNKPTKRYVFPPEQLKLHMSQSALGPSYSVWLPWDEIGGPQTEVSLICRFEPKNGGLVVGEQTRHRLNGILVAERTTPSGGLQFPSKPAVQQAMHTDPNSESENTKANYEIPAELPDTPQSKPGMQMTTTTISLPKNFRHR